MKPKAQIKTQLKQEDGAKIEAIVKEYGFLFILPQKDTIIPFQKYTILI